MTNVRYQVFVSSTFADLKEERSSVIQTLMEMDCIPAGMELFPAMDEEQWRFIQRIIDDCDYYILILGGRYGSISSDGISYTEKEFDYALSLGMKVLAFIHSEPDSLPVKSTDGDPTLKLKLDAFRERVSDGRLVKFWKDPKELPGLVALSMSKTIKTYPAVGWVRANTIASSQLLREQNELHKEVEQLRAQLEHYKSNEDQVEDLASVDDKFDVVIRWETRGLYSGKSTVRVTWKEIFAALAPDLQQVPSDGMLQLKLADSLYGHMYKDRTAKVDEESFKTIRVQLIALGLVTVEYGPTLNKQMALFWRLTTKGEAMMMKWRTVKSSAALPDAEEGLDS
ncbi:DUF4062 domain-containing protein [Sinorhizobium medicae]